MIPEPERSFATIAAVTELCTKAGLDLVHPFALSVWNGGAAVIDRLPDFGRTDALAFLIGNTRALWPVFTRRMREDATAAARAHPLDELVSASVDAAAAALPCRAVVRLGHVMTPRPVPLQRIAAATGLAALSPSYLSVHPELGPWIALRAVIVADLDAPPHLREVKPRRDPCQSCAAPCLPPFEAARAAGTPRLGEVRASWRRWLTVRDACPVGRSHRYGDAQIHYHYAGERPWPDAQG